MFPDMDLKAHLNRNNTHPVLQEPPLAHALHRWEEEKRLLTYEYNGRILISVHVPGIASVGFRHGSDGSLSSQPMVQQLYLSLDDTQETAPATMRILLSEEAINMRPRRAGSEEAILGHAGLPLIAGVNGLFDIRQDLLIDWHGRPWAWGDDQLKRDPAGCLYADINVSLSPMPWIINLRYRYYQQHLGYRYFEPWKTRPNRKPVAGWCSWEAFRRDVSQKDIEEVSRFFGRELQPFGLEYIQLDDGYETLPIPPDPEASVAMGWLTTNRQFPRGHEGVVQSVRQHGMEPGVWTSSNITSSEFAEKQPDCLIKGPDGKPMPGEWIDNILDCLPASLEKHLKPYYEGLKDKGYTYFKVDGIRHLLLDGLQEAVRMGLITNEEAENRFRRMMLAARDVLGPEPYYLASWGVLPQAVGVVDACRISMDANPTWAGIRMQMVESARWWFTNRILFLNDPDHICARAELEWARSIASLVSLSGQLFMLSDPLSTYTPERLKLLRKCLPTLTTVPGETGPLSLDYPAFTWTKLHGFAVPRENPVAAQGVEEREAINMAGSFPSMHDNHPLATLWAVHLRNEFRRWCVVGRFATIPLKASVVRMESLGLAPDQAYHVFDFWAEQFLGTFTGNMICSALALGHCQILAFVPAEKGLQFLASTRHVSMDAVSVKGMATTGDTTTVELEGVVGARETYWFHLPAAARLIHVGLNGVEIPFGVNGSLVTVPVDFLGSVMNLTLTLQS